MPESSLKERTVKGVGWSAADSFLGQGVTFVVGIILARLLGPEEYGLIGIVTIFTTILTGIVDSGFSTALIRKKDISNDDYNTMFFTNLVMSIILFWVLWFCSPLIARFFKRLELISLTRVMGLILVLQALSITQVTILTKRIDFKTKTKASLISAILSGIVGIGMAFLGFGVWSLVGQKLSNTFFYSVSLWLFNKWWPHFHFSKSSFKYMWGFGWKMMLSGLLNNIWNQLYQVVVGKCYSPSILGQYSRSKEYSHFFSSTITSIVDRVTYPVLAEVQDEKKRMVSAYRRVIKVTMFVSAIGSLFLAAVAEPFIYCLIGTKWHEAASYLPLISISMSLYPLHAINLNMLKVQGRSDIFLYLEIIKKIIAIGPLCLGIFVGIYWMLFGSIVTGLIAYFLNSYFTGRELNYSSFQQLRDITPSYSLGLLIAISVFFFKYLPISSYAILIIQIVVGTIVFFVVCEIAEFQEYKELKSIIMAQIRKSIKRDRLFDNY